MARITVEDCLRQIGNENRFSLIHLAIKRVKQHRNGAPFLVKCKNKEIVSTLREIASGQVDFASIRKSPPPKEDVLAPTTQTGDEQTEQVSL
ncbi:MAG TPA: DNA-directed RNA polymerase subunit omega [Desulfobulbaceae bacterium]|nr:MAG: DNA-directed RNA polymerase subunit omega [Deltaproteobacteria bacterium RIFOXYD12_FULL_53_23]HCC54822.1 DNA-directed RNA polymerase subunit omega [Desulfobulbaceae bacterium]